MNIKDDVGFVFNCNIFKTDHGNLLIYVRHQKVLKKLKKLKHHKVCIVGSIFVALCVVEN